METKIKLKELVNLQANAAKLKAVQTVLDEINSGDIMNAHCCLELISEVITTQQSEKLEEYLRGIKNALKNYGELTEVIRINNIKM